MLTVGNCEVQWEGVSPIGHVITLTSRRDEPVQSPVRCQLRPELSGQKLLVFRDLGVLRLVKIWLLLQKLQNEISVFNYFDLRNYCDRSRK
ncbi:unnamed protein product [Hermetia illucens]|uniref:Uncharacterized protein n=1 Tax=Hermetia illucens TaxID=343691 RepID=A0A7R8V4P2_HERIL|nr:unnamed protein product [Hermetia illucens]